MVILVSGGRDFNDYDSLKLILDEVATWADDGFVKIVEGDGLGAERMAGKWAREMGYGAHLVESRYGEPGPQRTQYLIDTFHPSQGVVFSGSGDEAAADVLVRLFYGGVNTWLVGR